MHCRPLVPALLAALALPLPALASDWEPSFPAPAVASYLPVEEGTIVVGAGAPSADLSEAEVALATALRGSGKARLVMDDAALGDVSALDDAAIVAKARPLPAPRVAVVRVFDGATGVPPTAVVTFYGREGQVVAAFSVERGGVLAAATPGDEAPGQGASRAAVEAVSQAAKTVVEATAQAKERYDREFLWFQDWRMVSVNRYGASVSTGSTPFQGKYQQNVEGERFYEILGRPDLVAAYRSADGVKTGVLIGSTALTLGGLGLMLAPLFSTCDIGAADYDACEGRHETMLWTGVAASLGGSLGVAIGLGIDPNPVDLVEARRLADEYNEKLKKELGLAERRQEPAGGIRAGLAALPGGAGLALSGTLP